METNSSLLSEEKHQLQLSNQLQEDMIAQLKNACEGKQVTIDSLTCQANEIKIQLDDSIKSKSLLTATIQMLQQTNAAILEKENGLQDENSALKGNIKSLDSELNDQKQLNKVLTQELCDTRNQIKDNNALCKDLEVSIKDRLNTISQLQQCLQGKDTENNNLLKTIHILEISNHKLLEQITQLKACNEDMTSVISTLKAEVEDEKRKYTALQENMATQSICHQQELRSVQKLFEGKVVDISNELCTSKTKFQALELHLQETDIKIQTLTELSVSNQNTIISLQADVNSKDNELAVLNAKYENLQTEKNENELKMETIRNAVSCVIVGSANQASSTSIVQSIQSLGHLEQDNMHLCSQVLHYKSQD